MLESRPAEACNVCGPKHDSNRGFYEHTQFFTALFLYPIICLIGLIGNVLTVVVLTDSRMRSSTNSYLIALAVSDAIKLLVDMFYFIVILSIKVDPAFGNQAYGYLYPYAHYLFNVSLSTTAWLTVSVAAERYVLVCRSPSAKRRCSVRRSQIISGIVFGSMSVLSIPFAFRYQTVIVADNVTNATVAFPKVTDLWLNDSFAAAYTWFQNLLRSVVPLFILGVLNTCIVRALQRAGLLTAPKPPTKSTTRNTNSTTLDDSLRLSVDAVDGESQRVVSQSTRLAVHRRRIAVMLVTIIIMFTVCVTPDAVMSTVFGFGYHDESYLIRGVREITDLLLTVNSAFNFVIYYAFNPAFRRRLRSLFYRTCCFVCCCCYCSCLSPSSCGRGDCDTSGASRRVPPGLDGVNSDGLQGPRGGNFFKLRLLGRNARGRDGRTTFGGHQFRSTGFATARRTSQVSNEED